MECLCVVGGEAGLLEWLIVSGPGSPAMSVCQQKGQELDSYSVRKAG